MANDYQRWAAAISALNDATQRELTDEFLVSREHEGVDMPRLLHGAMGLVGEAGEMMQHILKHLFAGYALSPEVLKKELGDCYWYMNEAATALGISFSDVIATNVRKLVIRYPEHRFSTARSQAADRSPEAESTPIHDVSCPHSAVADGPCTCGAEPVKVQP